MSLKYVRAIRHLRRLANWETFPISQNQGVCYELKMKCNLDFHHLIKVSELEKWKHFSGYSDFPVSHPELSPACAYHYGKLWTGNLYGLRRRNLCAFLADHLEKRLKIHYSEEKLRLGFYTFLINRFAK